MLNFNMKPCIPDGRDSVQIAKRIKKRCLKKQNKLLSLLEMKFTSTVTSSDINTINDFPKLKLSQIRKRITLGSFKLRQSQSYLEQIILNGQVYFLNKKCIENHVKHPKVLQELNYSKIFAVLIPSRHKRGKKWKKHSDLKNDDSVDPKSYNTYYKIFIQYTPIEISEIMENNHMKPYINIKSKRTIFLLLKIKKLYFSIRIYLQLFKRSSSCRMLCSCGNSNLLFELCKRKDSKGSTKSKISFITLKCNFDTD